MCEHCGKTVSQCLLVCTQKVSECVIILLASRSTEGSSGYLAHTLHHAAYF